MSKLGKFRNSPERFFADSRHAVVRAVGRVVGPRLAGSELVMEVLESPLDALGDSGLPVVAAIAEGERRRRARRRREVLDRAGRPLVSVVVAARNASATVERAVRSLLAQTYSSLEIVVVDDASEDGTLDVVRGLGDPRVRWLRSDARGGAARARNLGLAAATGAYLAFQDADDVSHPERIERQLGALLAQRAAVCVCNSLRESPDGRRVIVNGRRYTRSMISMLFPRDPVLERVGYMLPLTVGEDTEYFERIRTVFGERSVAHVFETLYRARFAPGSLLFSSGTTSVRDRHVSFTHAKENDRALAEALARLERVRRGLEPAFVPLDPAGASEADAEPRDEDSAPRAP